MVGVGRKQSSRTVLIAFTAIALGCAPKGVGEDFTSRQQALATSNGLAQNGLSTNGLASNGFWANGFWANGFWANGFWANGFWANGFWANGFWANGFWANGFWANGFWANGLTGPAAVPGETLRSNAYARELLQYIYSCAMPATAYDTTLDPNAGAPLLCTSDSDCDAGYACGSEGTCVIPLKGGGANGSGLAINDDLSTWWGQPAPGGRTDLTTGKWGQCDESCQRWVSACVLARTNAYGEHVDLSLRAPAEAPPPIEAALRTTAAERDTFSTREGAFYGNIFATTPIDATTGLPAAYPGTDGPATGPIASTPKYFACAGPDSNIPAITRRFCSSQGDQVVIAVPGMCLPRGTELGTCAGQDASDDAAIHDCHTSAQPEPIAPCATGPDLDPTCYREVLTVYLDVPRSSCGNGVCEDDNSPTSPETAASCPSDCHPGTWAKDFPDNKPEFGSYNESGSASPQYAKSGMIALGPRDTVVAFGTSASDLTIEDRSLPYGSAGQGVLVTYNPDGTILDAFRWRLDLFDFLNPQAAVVAANGDITLSGWNEPGALPEQWFARFTKEGTKIAEWEGGFNGSSLANADGQGTTRFLALDSSSDVIAAGSFNSMFGPLPFGTTDRGSAVWVAKYSASGTHEVLWSAILGFEPTGETQTKYPLSLAVDGADNVVLAYRFGNEYRVQKLSADGTSLWAVSGGADAAFTSVAFDASGNAYAAGYFAQGHDFGRGPETSVTGLPPFLVKYDASGAFQWVSYPQIFCPSWAPDCGGTFAQSDEERRRVEGETITFDEAGLVVLGGFGNPGVGGDIDFGRGRFPMYGANNIFLSAYRPESGDVVWAKQVDTVVGGTLIDLKVDSHDRVIVAGKFSGSVEVDDYFLKTEAPESPSVVDTFLASFNAPSTDDHAAPDVGGALDHDGVRFSTLPRDIVVQATGPSGAAVFYTVPSALDDGHAGVLVACSPRPNTTFPLGTTSVSCTASDPVGNSASAAFSVTVVDKIGPFLSAAPTVPPVSTVSAGATVTYSPPTAIDQVDGPRPVVCAPASGHVFTVGATTVTCTSSDTHGNTSSTSFPVVVFDVGAPVLTLPGPITATATSTAGAVVTYTATAVDAVDGVITPVCARASGSTFPLRSTTVNCTATDTAGNRATGSFTVTVQYAWSGVLPPVDANGESVFKLGSTVPVKFKLVGASAPIKDAVATLTLTKVSSKVTGCDLEAVSTSAATTGNLFRYSGGQYIFNLSTKPLSAGTWRLSIDLGDGVSRTVVISLR